MTVKEYPVIDEIKTFMKSHGALNALMSGSGPTVFGVFDSFDRAQSAGNALKQTDLAKQVFVTRPFNISGGR